MADYRRIVELDRSWEQVLAARYGKRTAFDVMNVSASGDEMRIRNSDNTVTVLRGKGLASKSAGLNGSGEAATLIAGTISQLQRIAVDDTVIEEVTGLDVAAGGDDLAVSFSRPPGSLSSIAWALNGGAAALPASVPAPDVAASGVAAGAAPAAADVEVDGYQRPDAAAIGPRPGHGLHGRSVNPKAVLILLAPVLLAVVAAMWLTTDPADGDRARIKWKFSRPASIPSPPDNIPSAAKVDIGQRMFNDGRLSGDGSVSCATCHNPKLGYADGVPFGTGIARKRLPIHTPALWNLAWGHAMFWDGRLPTLEAQALAPIQNPIEMGASLDQVVARLRSDPATVAGFAAAFPESPEISSVTLGKALASYQRTLVSPPTRFDRWIEGSPSALTEEEKAGFSIFTGKAGCANCHAGWAFTDYAFHDIGLATTAKGRGHVLKRPALEFAFKTPSLREIAWTAPYMHNGSMTTLEQVVRHYETGGVDRPTRSPDMPRRIRLSDVERANLIAFLKTLSSDRLPQPALEVAATAAAGASATPDVLRVGQKDKRFSMDRMRIKAGQSLVIVNDDNQPHNVFVADPRMSYDSGWQSPGEQVQVPFPRSGDFDVFCGIHPNMRLRVEVEPAPRK